MPPPPELPRPVLERLSLYLRQLEALDHAGKKMTSSSELGKLLGLTPAQVRKDFAAVGTSGARGVGYRVQLLADALRRTLGTDRVWPIALVGVGHLGSALVRHKQFANQGFRFSALFDRDPALAGKTIEGLTIRPIQDLERVLEQEGIRLAMLAVPAPAAQSVADALVRAGVKGVLNFTSAALDVPEDVAVVAVDLALYLEKLTYHLAHILRSI